jgi:hypothetical protein
MPLGALMLWGAKDVTDTVSHNDIVHQVIQGIYRGLKFLSQYIMGKRIPQLMFHRTDCGI